jgi:2-polyprenyl-3-methyl-5-hydroxy-6-metoxy-1,4-benzoquinol methylase
MDEKASWNKKYSEGSHASLEPDPFLVSACQEFLSGQRAGSALDVAGGVGRHAIWLARRGWRVRLLDISEIGIGLAEKNAAKALGPVAKEFLISAEVADLNKMRSLRRPAVRPGAGFLLSSARTLPCSGFGAQAGWISDL